jgi:hypothetical protein
MNNKVDLTRPWDIPDSTSEKLFQEFIEGLEKLSKKTGVYLNVTGGVQIVLPKSIEKVEYSDDWSSGDLRSVVTLIDGRKI